MYEREKKESFDDLKKEDQPAVSGDGKMDVDYSEDDEDDEETLYELGQRYKSKYEAKAKEAKSIEKNSYLEVGMATDRTFVVRGSQIGVFKSGKRDEDLTYVGKINQVKDQRGNLFSPEKAILHDQDSKMILLPQGDRQRAFLMDLEREKVVEEWQGPESFNFEDLTPATKYQPITGGSLVAGVNSNTVFRLDPRISTKNKLADHKMYKTNYQFGCITTNEDGNLAVGSQKGELRLYSDASKIAKVAFPGLGDLIKGVDTTADGKWVLGTCKNYLLLYNVLGRSGKTGFQKRMLKDEKPVPLKLQLRPEDIAKHGITNIDFATARFNLGDNEEEMISTSTGPFLIVWSFAAIKKSGAKARFRYRINKLDDAVVGEKFQYNSKRMVVTMKDDVVLQTLDPKKSRPRRRRHRYEK